MVTSYIIHILPGIPAQEDHGRHTDDIRMVGEQVFCHPGETLEGAIEYARFDVA
jgi:hypothetical protein